MSDSPSSKSRRTWRDTLLSDTIADDPIHPAQIAARTYAVSLSLSLVPALLPYILSLARGKKSKSRGLLEVFKKELAPSGFAFAITTAVGGGAALQRIWQYLDDHEIPLDYDSGNGTPVNGHRHAPYKSNRSVLGRLWSWIRALNLSVSQKAFIANIISSTIAITLLHSAAKRRSRAISPPLQSESLPLQPPLEIKPLDTNVGNGAPPTLDLTILLAVRAIDAIIQIIVFRRSKIRVANSQRDTPNLSAVDAALQAELKQREEIKWREKMTTRIDALVFWGCCSRIMWCFFYQPDRLPPAYVKWIGKLAIVDPRIVKSLQAVREGQWSYLNGSDDQRYNMVPIAKKFGLPGPVADCVEAPAYGGAYADAIWEKLGYSGRPGLGGIPCDIVHGTMATKMGLGTDCYSNSLARFLTGFAMSVPIYLSAHFIPMLLLRPKSILKPHRVLTTLGGVVRSAAFLATFISSYWTGVCLGRSVLLPRLFPWVSWDFWDGPKGGIMLGSILCGTSILIEAEKRRGEMSLYVVPKTVRAILPLKWINSGALSITIAERFVFIVSLASLLTSAVYHPNSLRGLSRWVLSFVMRGPNTGFWLRRKRQLTTAPPTPGPGDRES